MLSAPVSTPATSLVRRGRGSGIGAAQDTAPDGELPALFSYLLRVPKPVIAAVNGVAAGGGFVLAMMCDLRFAAEGASFTTVFSKRGLIAEHGTSWLLPRLVGLSRALDLLWSSRRFDAAEALRIGFVDRVVADDRVLDEACAYIRDLAANVSPRSLAVIKAQVYRHLSLEMESAIRESDKMMNEALAHPDAAEGVASFVERRRAAFPALERRKIMRDKYEHAGNNSLRKVGSVATLTDESARSPQRDRRSDDERAERHADRAAEDHDLRVLVLTGAGRGFCAGADLQTIVAGERSARRARESLTDVRLPHPGTAA